MTTITNESNLDLTLCEGEITVTSNSAESEELDLTINKTVNCPYYVVGNKLTYCTTIKNNSEYNFEDLTWRDTLASRLTYVEDSFTVNGTAETPTQDGQELSYDIASLAEDETITICFQALVGSV